MSALIHIDTLIYLVRAHRDFKKEFGTFISKPDILKVYNNVLQVLVCLYMCVCLYVWIRGQTTALQMFLQLLKHPLVSLMLPSLLKAWAGLAASSNHWVVDIVPYGVFLLHNWLSQFCQLTTEPSAHKYTYDSMCVSGCASPWILAFVCDSVCFSLSFSNDVCWEALSEAKAFFSPFCFSLVGGQTDKLSCSLNESVYDFPYYL